MPEIKAFRGWRYNTDKVSSLAKVVAPPYDVISPKQQAKLYTDNPYNVIRLELGKDESGDNAKKNKYTRAAEYLQDWKAKSVLVREEKPAIYVYVQDYTEEGKKKTRVGFLSIMRIDEKSVLKHENTLAAPKADRLKLLQATQTNLSPIFGLFEDASGNAQKALKKSMTLKPFTDVTIDGVRHRIYIETRPEVIGVIEKTLRTKPMYIADGHHRFETSCNYKRLMGKGKKLKGENSWEYVMTYFTDCLHNPFKIFPTHRLIKVKNDIACGKLEKLGTIKKVKNLDAVLQYLEKNREEVKGKPYDFGFYCRKAGYSVFRMHPEVAKKVKNNPVDRLDVAVLHNFIVDPCFGIQKIEKSELIDFTRDPKDAVQRVQDGTFDLALFLRPTSMQEMILASKKGLKMPQKSTYFYPKLLSGLVFHGVS